VPDYANLRKALLCQGEPKRVPALEYSIDPSIKAQLLGRPVRSVDDEAEFSLKAGYDVVPIAYSFKQILTERGAAAAGHGHMKKAEAQYSANDEQTSTRLWAEAGNGLITDQASFDNFDWPDPDDYPYEKLERLGQILPSEAKALPLVGYIFAGTWMLMGFERFCYDLADGAPLAARIADRLGQFAHRIVENVLQYDCVGAVCMPDDMAYTTSLMVKPDFLRRHVFPWDKKIGRLVHGKRLPYCLHSDGRYVPVIDDLIECGFDAIHPCEPASMDMVELKKQYGGRLCLCGNINLDSTLTLGTPDEVEEEVKLRICTIGPGGGYCCGSSNSVTEYVPYANYQAMIGAIKKYGEYSISGFQAGDSRRPLRNAAARGPT